MSFFSKMAGGGTRPPRAKVKGAFIAGFGAFLAIGVLGAISTNTAYAVMMAPFGASCFLAFAAPDTPLAQPRHIVFGHLIAALAGYAALFVLGPTWIAGAVGVGAAIFFMLMTRTGHAPAGATPLVIIAFEPSWQFLLFPVLSGAILVVLVALIYHNSRPSGRYPQYW